MVISVLISTFLHLTTLAYFAKEREQLHIAAWLSAETDKQIKYWC